LRKQNVNPDAGRNSVNSSEPLLALIEWKNSLHRLAEQYSLCHQPTCLADNEQYKSSPQTFPDLDLDDVCSEKIQREYQTLIPLYSDSTASGFNTTVPLTHSYSRNGQEAIIPILGAMFMLTLGFYILMKVDNLLPTPRRTLYRQVT
jgi:hypothetical protein